MKLRLTEHKRLDAVPLSGEQVTTLLSAGAQLSLSPSPGRAGHYDITPGSYVGALRLGDLDIEIRPKVPVENLMFLLSHASEHQKLLPVPATVTAAPTVHEAAAGWFDILISRAFRRGILQGYRLEERDLIGLRGRALFDEQLRRRPLQLLPHACRYDDYTEDTEQNRVLRATLRLLLSMPLRSRDLKRRLTAHEAELERVRVVHYDARHLPAFRFDRLNEHYRPVLELALLLLAGQAPTLRIGRHEVRALLFDMNSVFETFVHRALQRTLRLDDRSFPPQCRGHAVYLDLAHSIKLQPDLSWWHLGRCIWVGDAKYKRVARGSEPNADVFQALSYCHGTGLRRATLIYASDLGAAREIRVKEGSVVLELAGIDLSQAPHSLLQQIDRLASSICTHAGAASHSTLWTAT